MAAKKKNKVVLADRPLLLATLLLLGFGLIMVFSASAIMAQQRFGSPYLFLRKQLLWDGFGVIVLLFGMRVDYHQWQRWSYALLGIAFASLVTVLIFGRVIKGARRWIQFHGITFQPSELAKLALILWLADYLDRRKSHLGQWKGFLPVVAVLGIVCATILKEPDLGTPMLLGTIGFMLMFLAGTPVSFLGGSVIATLPVLYYELFHVGYRQRRLMAFTNPWADAKGTGYQLTQSLLAFGSGGLFGKGLGASTLKLLSLPDPHTDFIFPVIGEELGFVGACGLILLFVFWGLRGWQAAKRAPDLFGQLLAAGLTSWVMLQAAINMGVSSGLLPTKGLPLPFVSFGGSSLVITMFSVGILLNISGQGYLGKVQDLRPARRKSSR